METAYIFTRGQQIISDDFCWYLDYFKSLQDAQAACPEGWEVQRYCDFEWRY